MARQQSDDNTNIAHEATGTWQNQEESFWQRFWAPAKNSVKPKVFLCPACKHRWEAYEHETGYCPNCYNGIV